MGKRINWAGVSGLFLSDAEVAEARHALALARSVIRSGEKETAVASETFDRGLVALSPPGGGSADGS